MRLFRRSLLTTLALATVVAPVAAALPAAADQGDGSMTAVIVSGPSVAGAAAAVRGVGGTVGLELGIVSGVAPAARIISVKVAGADGSTNLSKVIAGIGWVVVNQDEVGASVLNLSLGVDAPVRYEKDPLSAAVEAAWSSGLTVVVAAGNMGKGTVTSPGHDPFVITVGATDPHGTATVDDDSVPSWSGSDKEQGVSKPELLA